MTSKMTSNYRPYSTLLDKNAGLEPKIQSTIDFYTSSAEVFLNFWLSLRGGYSLSDNPHLCFLHWFSAESKDFAPTEYIVPEGKLLNTFCDYYLEIFGKTPDKSQLTFIQENAKSEECVFVDRHKAFVDLKNKYNIPEQAVDCLLKEVVRVTKLVKLALE